MQSTENKRTRHKWDWKALQGIAAGPAPSAPGQGFLSDECRILDRYELQTELVDTLRQTRNFKKLVPRVAACSHTFRHWRCENNHDWAEAENSCSVRVCPHCSRRRSLILAGRFQKAVMGREGLRYVVLAEENCTDLKAGIASLWQAWTNLRRSVRWKAKVRGCIVALEVTRNKQDGSWHPHLNLLIEGEYFPFEELNQAWRRATRGRGRTSYIRAADEGTVTELIKYVTKVSDLVGDAAALDEFLLSVSRVRLVRTYGTFYGINVDDEENPGIECPDCGSHTNVRLSRVAPAQVSFDFEKEVFRVSRSPGRIRSDLNSAAAFNVNAFDLDTSRGLKRLDWNKRACDSSAAALDIDIRERLQEFERRAERRAIQETSGPYLGQLQLIARDALRR